MYKLVEHSPVLQKGIWGTTGLYYTFGMTSRVRKTTPKTITEGLVITTTLSYFISYCELREVISMQQCISTTKLPVLRPTVPSVQKWLKMEYQNQNYGLGSTYDMPLAVYAIILTIFLY